MTRDYNEHTPEPWHLSSGAVWADTDEKQGIALRAWSSPIVPYVRDNNMKRIVACVNALAGIPTRELDRINRLANPLDRLAALEAVTVERLAALRAESLPEGVKVENVGTDHFRVTGTTAYLKQQATRNPTRWGTAHFVSVAAAVLYYEPYEGSREAAERAVQIKLREGEIHLGPPTNLKPGDRIVTIDNGTRYAIEEGTP